MATINRIFQWHHHHVHHPTHQSEAWICILKYAYNCLLFKSIVEKKNSWSSIQWVIESLLYIVLWFAWSGLRGPSRTFPSFPITGYSQHPKTRQRPQLWWPGSLPGPGYWSHAFCNSLWLSQTHAKVDTRIPKQLPCRTLKWRQVNTRWTRESFQEPRNWIWSH